MDGLIEQGQMLHDSWTNKDVDLYQSSAENIFFISRINQDPLANDAKNRYIYILQQSIHIDDQCSNVPLLILANLM